MVSEMIKINELNDKISKMAEAIKNTIEAFNKFSKVIPSRKEVILESIKIKTSNVKGFVTSKYWRRWQIAVQKRVVLKKIENLLQNWLEKIHVAQEN